MGSSSRDQKFKIHSTFKTTCFPLMSSMFGDVLYPVSKKPIPAQKSRMFKQQAPLNWAQHPKAKKENHLPMYKPLQSPFQSHPRKDLKTLPGPQPKLPAASTAAPAEISSSTTAACSFEAAKCSAVWPRALGMSHGRQGGCRLLSRNKTIAMECFSGWLGKTCGYRS